jgi:Na+/H+-translocating membrane pyrophosphatase
MRLQLMLMTFIMCGSLYLAAYLTFPPHFTVSSIYERYYDIQQPWIPYLCSVIGIASAVILCIFNYFFTSSNFFPIQSLVESSRSSSAANLANGLALGYISTIVPILIIALAIYFSNMLLSFYGVGLAVVGVLSGMPIFLVHHILGPLADSSYNMALLLNLGE